jgi:hypothetical protein
MVTDVFYNYVRSILALALCIISPTCVVLAQAVSEPASLQQRTVFYADGAAKRFPLDFPYRVHLASLRVQLNGVTQKRDSTYFLQQPPPVILLPAPPPRGSMLVVEYTVIPVTLENAYFNRRPVAVDPSVPDSGYTRVTAQSPSSSGAGTRLFEDPDFEKSGSLTRGLVIGSNRGVRLNSGLRLQLRGKIQDDLEILANLNDDNSPLQPEGNTRTLSEIDKVFFQLRGKQFETTLGDYELHFDGTQFADYHRTLEGISGRAAFGSRSATISAASTQGDFHINKFFGQEGNQGPWQLTGKSGERNIVVVGGTEKVWIDGREMTRGENHDYTIEYASGEVTFTRRRLITADSRIEVEFQYFTGQFKKSFLSFRTEGQGLGQNMQYRLTLLRERDGEGDPLDFAYLENQPGYLSKTKGPGYVDPALFYVGEGRGEYVRADTLGITIYQYVGIDKGAYLPVFTNVGFSRGDYARASHGYYYFVGKGEGEYLPIHTPAVQREQDLADLELQYKQAEWLALSGELAMSRLQEDAGDLVPGANRQGGATHVTAALTPKNMHLGSLPIGSGRLSTAFTKRSNSFEEMSRTRQVEYHRKWDIRDAEAHGEETLEVQADWQPRTMLALQGSLGRLRAGAGTRSDREQYRVQVGSADKPVAMFRQESLNSARTVDGYRGDWVRQWGEASHTVHGLQPSVEFEREVKKEQFSELVDDGFRFYRFKGGLSYNRDKWLELNTSVERRSDARYTQDHFEQAAVSQTQQYAMTLKPGFGFTSTNSFIRRVKEFESGSPATTTLADMLLAWQPRRRYVNLSTNFQMSQERAPQREEVYFDVGEGQGEYRYDSLRDEYVPDPFGSYIRRTFSTTSFQAVRGIRLGGSFDVSARRLLSKKKDRSFWYALLQGMGSKSQVRYEVKQEVDAPNEPAAVDPGILSSSDFLNHSFWRQDLLFLENYADSELRLRYNRDHRLSREIITRAEEREQDEQSLRFRTRLMRYLGFQVEAGRHVIRRTFATQTQASRNILAHRGTSSIFITPQTNIEYILKVQYSREEDRSPQNSTGVRLVGITPTLRYALTNRGRFTGEAGWFRVRTDNDMKILPYELAEGRYPGTSYEWRMNFQYRVSSHLTANFEYNGDRRERSVSGQLRNIVYHQARAEIRAFF